MRKLIYIISLIVIIINPSDLESCKFLALPQTDGISKDIIESIIRKEKIAKLEKFLDRFVERNKRVQDGTVYERTPFKILINIFVYLETTVGVLNKKHLFEFGCGADLRGSLFGNYIYNMNITAVEKDKHVSKRAGEVYKQAKIEHFISEDNSDVKLQTDAFSLVWKDFNMVYAFWTQPPGRRRARIFRGKFIEKAQEMKPDSIIAVLFTLGQITKKQHVFPGLDSITDMPIPIGFEGSSYYLGLFRPTQNKLIKQLTYKKKRTLSALTGSN